MSIDRRRFVRTGLSAVALLGGGFPAVASTLPASAAVPVMPRMSLEEFVRDPNRVADLRKGVDAMKARKPSHPDSWFFQGAIHAVRADWIADAAKVDPDVNKVDQAKFWNQCPHNPRYGSADFLLWHRAYLHYFEGILRKASGNPVLSLPYWNYPVAARRNLPEIYRVPASSANPLFITQRVAAMNAGTGQLSPGAVSLDALTKKVFFGTTSGADVFGGLIAIGSEPGNKGAIERVPHDTVHGGVGGATGWMGSVPTAAFDPIFWPHHTEIDHLFTSWDCVGQVNWGPYQVSWFDAKPWFFHDADGQVQNNPRRYYVDNASLNVRYDDQKPTCTPLPAPRAVEHPVNILQRFASPQAVRLGSSSGVHLSASVPVSRTVTLATRQRLGAANNAVTFAANSPRKLILEVGEITFTTPPSVAYDVYVDLPPGTPPDREGPYHVGTLTFFGLGSEGMPMPNGPGELFDISRIARRPGFDPAKLQVTFVPFDLVVTASGGPGTPRESTVTVGTLDVRAVDTAP